MQVRFGASFGWQVEKPQNLSVLNDVQADPIFKSLILDSPETEGVTLMLKDNDLDDRNEFPWALYASGEKPQQGGKVQPWQTLLYKIKELPKDQTQVVPFVHEILKRFQRFILDKNQKSFGIVSLGNTTAQPLGTPTKTETPTLPASKVLDKETYGFARVAGMTQLKELLAEKVIGPLKSPEEYKKYGLGIPDGALLFGPPGCGKTYIAKNLAGELGYNFVEATPSSTGSKWAHESTQNIKALFDEAEKKAPCVLFLDEIDALAQDRDTLTQDYKTEEVNELLLQMNAASERGIFVITATNKPWILDTGFRRSGRTDLLIYVPPPDLEARSDIARMHMKGRYQEEALDYAEIGRVSEGLTASDIKFWVDEASRLAMKQKKPIGTRHFIEAREQVTSSLNEGDLKRYEEVQTRGMNGKNTQRKTARQIGFNPAA